MAETKKRGPGRPPGSKNKKTTSSNKSTKKESSSSVKTKQEHIDELRLQSEKDKRTIDVIWSITLIAIGIFLLCTVVRKSTGALGVKIHDICLGLFGIMGYILPFLFLAAGVLLLMKKLQHVGGRTAICGVFIFFQMCILNSYRFIDESRLAFGFADIVRYYKMGVNGDKGGAIGMELGSLIVKFFGKAGLLIIAIAILIICIFLVADTPISQFFENWSHKRETKHMMAELDAAEKEKVRQAVDAVAVERPYDMKDTFVTTPDYNLNSSEPKQNGRLLGRLRRTNVDVNPVMQTEQDNSKYDCENVGSDIQPSPKTSTNIGYGLNTDNFGNSGSYGLNPDDYNSSSRGMGPKQSQDPQGQEALAKSRKINSGINPYKKAKEPIEIATAAAVEVPNEAFKINNKKNNDASSDIETEIMGEALSSALNAENVDHNYELPPVSLLKKGSANKQQMTDIQLEQKADLLEQTLRDFGVEATVLEVTQGASVTRYEVQPATGVKVSSITKLADDIALNLRAKTIRIEAPIPGKAAVGIEVENDKPSPVVVRDLIESDEFLSAKSKISFIVGKDISGRNIVADLKSMPHLLIAGATGSGKSVCINTIIASFLYKAKPNELKLIMVDPKVVELQSYNGIPHMLVPVVTDPRKASKALAIAVQEMDKRYEAFAKCGVKDLDSYNEYMIAEQEYANVKPQIVIIIDELADLMMACSNEVETSICRLAQKARAAGMHLIVATQRPSVDVVTGLIKANIPSRIAFSVSSSTDSRTILDMGGAEKLLGKGDMLFSPVGSNKPYRVQGPFITEAETNKLIKFVKQQGGDAQYDQEVQKAIDSDGKSQGAMGSPEDELTEDAIAFILKSKQASVSMLQRRFRIGYNRAARIIDEIEEKGIIGPSDGSRPRQVLITEDEYYGEFDDSENVVVEENSTLDEEPEVTNVSYGSSDNGVNAFSSLPESVQKEILSSDD